MNRRRKLLVALGASALVPSSWAQTTAPARIAWIGPGSASAFAMRVSAFKDGMRENGLLEGQHYILDERYAEGNYDRFPALTDELIKRSPAIIMVNTIASVRAAQQATKTIPILFVSTNDPVGSGLIASLARPGGNTTGLSTQFEDVVTKNLEILREAVPHASRIAILVNPGNPSSPKLFEMVRASVGGFGIDTRAFEAANPQGLDAAFNAIRQYQPDALLVVAEAMFFSERDRIAASVLKQRIPAMCPQSEFAVSGCLMSYGTNSNELYRRAATYAKKILAGAKPADLPVEQPTTFELFVNRKTANALGIKIPNSILLRADKVIE